MQQIEKVLREKLAAAHHIIYFMGWDDILATHISVKIPNTEHILITPLNIPFEEISASKIVKSDLNGNPIGNSDYGIMPQATNIHTSVYKANSSVMGVVHTHSTYGTAVASLEAGFLFINQHALCFYNDIGYHDYDGLALEDEGEQIVASLGNKTILVLRNHGLLTTGRTIEEALVRMYYMETYCEMQVKTMSANSKIITISDDVCKKTKTQYESILTLDFLAETFNALVRRIENKSRVNFRD